MQRCLAVASLLVLFASPVMAAANQPATELIFSFSGLGDVRAGSFDGGIGCRKYLSNGLALRPSVRLGVLTMKTDGQAGTTDDRFTSTVVNLGVAIEKHVGGSGAISPYLGAGAEVGALNTKLEYSHAIPPAPGDGLSTTGAGPHFGVFALCGFLWSFSRGMSLGGEYQLGLTSTSLKLEDNYQAMPAITTRFSHLDLGLGTASLAVSVEL